MSTFGSESAQLEREVEAQRQKVENRIGEIRDRLSPGQLVDELLNMTKDGGQNFTANLGHTVGANPLPATLLGISLVWLMSSGNKGSNSATSSSWREDDEHPYATISGRLRRTAHEDDGTGEWYSSFADDAGRTYRAKSDQLGHRAGHFMDDAGRKFGGFIDETGHRVKDIRDEAGNKLEEATGWVSQTWSDVKRQVSDTTSQVADQAKHLGGNVQNQADRASRMLLDTFQNQPLVAGALAFAAGAALGAALPHPAQEDAAVGELGDKVRGKAAEVASDVYEEGKARAADLYEKGKDGVAELYDDVVRQAADEQSSNTGQPQSYRQ
jgi:hypothetical protein